MKWLISLWNFLLESGVKVKKLSYSESTNISISMLDLCRQTKNKLIQRYEDQGHYTLISNNSGHICVQLNLWRGFE